jgi:hypothetical protein
MTQTEHLERIKSRCLANLTLAEKRTPGEWTAWTNEVNGERAPAKTLAAILAAWPEDSL